MELIRAIAFLLLFIIPTSFESIHPNKLPPPPPSWLFLLFTRAQREHSGAASTNRQLKKKKKTQLLTDSHVITLKAEPRFREFDRGQPGGYLFLSSPNNQEAKQFNRPTS